VETDTKTDTHTHTDTQTKYSNPRCACAPRVNEWVVNNLLSGMAVDDVSALLQIFIRIAALVSAYALIVIGSQKGVVLRIFLNSI